MKRILLSEHFKTCRKCGIEKPTEEFGLVKPGRGDHFNRPSRCKACRSARNNQWHAENSQRAKENHAKWSKHNAAHVSSYNKRVRETNPTRHSLNYRRWARENSAYLATKQNMRRLSNMRATPSWLSPIDMARMEEFYEISAAKSMQTGIPYEVDHIVPLKGETVCGLHVPWNFQLLTAPENASKKNKLLEVI